MSGEVNYASFAGSPGRNPKYLSDALVNEYGSWKPKPAGVPALSIAYDNLPTGDALARIYTDLDSNEWFAFEFDQNQCVGDSIMYLDFYAKVSAQCIGMLFAQPDAVGAGIGPSGMSLYWNSVWTFAAAPLNWTRYKVKLGRGDGTVNGWNLNYGGPQGIASTQQRLKTITFYIQTASATLNISRCTIRRL